MTRLTAVLACLWASGATAQSNCAERDIAEERLSNKYQEQIIGAGFQNAQSIFQVWVSDEKGTWTILMVRPDNISCIMASGTNWRDMERKPSGVPG